MDAAGARSIRWRRESRPEYLFEESFHHQAVHSVAGILILMRSRFPKGRIVLRRALTSIALLLAISTRAVAQSAAVYAFGNKMITVRLHVAGRHLCLDSIRVRGQSTALRLQPPELVQFLHSQTGILPLAQGEDSLG